MCQTRKQTYNIRSAAKTCHKVKDGNLQKTWFSTVTVCATRHQTPMLAQFGIQPPLAGVGLNSSSRWDFMLVTQSIIAFTSTFLQWHRPHHGLCDGKSRRVVAFLLLLLKEYLQSRVDADVHRRASSYVADIWTLFIHDLHHQHQHQPWKTSLGGKSHGCMLVFCGLHLDVFLSFKHLPGLSELHARLSANMQLLAHWNLLQ